MKLKDIQNGSLYYNEERERVERVISKTFSNARVVTYFHKKEEGSVPVKDLRIANPEEVEDYLRPYKEAERTMKALTNRLSLTVD
tara:strand:- start:252 stop:506 length:255 start_codon:yes stop_codon:yes gene_type:complete